MTEQSSSNGLPPTAQLFCRLVSIPSPSGAELRVGQFIQSRLDMLGITSKFDVTGPLNDSNAGNLIAELPGTVDEHVLLVAHMDTVELGDQRIVPYVDGDRIRSRGSTILGADNKSGVASLIDALGELRSVEPRPHVTAAFTTREESGSMGVGLMTVPDTVRYAFALDGSDPVGTVYTATRGQLPFEIEVRGPEAHAALIDRDDPHALKAAAEILAAVDFGNRDDGSGLTISIVRGGVAVNVVPRQVLLGGEVRAFDQDLIDARLGELREVCRAIEDRSEAIRIRLRTYDSDGAPPFDGGGQDVVDIAERAARLTNVSHAPRRELFTSEVNLLTGRDLSVLGVCSGGTDAHTNAESIAIDELVACKEYIVNLVRETVAR